MENKRLELLLSLIEDRRLYFGVMPDKIEMLLDDCLGLIDRDLKGFIEGVAQGATD